MHHDEDVSPEQSAENDRYGDYIESLETDPAITLETACAILARPQPLRWWF